MALPAGQALYITHKDRNVLVRTAPLLAPVHFRGGPSVGLVEVLASASWQPRPLR